MPSISKAYSSQMKQAEDYQTLKEVIFLAIVDFIMFPDKPHYKSDHIILDKDSFEHDLKDFSFAFLELGKFTNAKEELSSITDKWAYFFKHADETAENELHTIIGSDDILKRAYEELNRFSWKDEELQDYE